MELKRTLEEALACFEAFRRLGFPANEIFFMVDDRMIFMCLKSQGKEFTVTCGLRQGTVESVTEEWNKMAEAWNDEMLHRERERIWVNSMVAKHSDVLIARLMAKGFEMPEPSNDEKARLTQKRIH